MLLLQNFHIAPAGAREAGHCPEAENGRCGRRRLNDDRKQEKPNPVDTHVGSRVRLRRTMLGMSQEKLGEALGITFQQIQKYEKGSNRIGASRLQRITEVLNVPVSFSSRMFPAR